LAAAGVADGGFDFVGRGRAEEGGEFVVVFAGEDVFEGVAVGVGGGVVEVGDDLVAAQLEVEHFAGGVAAFPAGGRRVWIHGWQYNVSNPPRAKVRRAKPQAGKWVFVAATVGAR
jgi:hypothetical protein